MNTEKTYTIILNLDRLGGSFSCRYNYITFISKVIPIMSESIFISIYILFDTKKS